MPDHSLHSQLLADCHLLGEVDSGSLLLSRNRAMHWFILVPETDSQDLLDLPAAALHRVMADCRGLSQFLKQDLGYPKVNFAGLGNVVPQMHLHLIGRREGDACWPQPVWGRLEDAGAWPPGDLLALTEGLTIRAGLRPSADPQPGPKA